MIDLGPMTWPEVAATAPLLVVPLGSLEQHGPHLPLDTDTRIAVAVAAEVAERAGAVLAPALAYGASGEHAGFAGTLSLGCDAFESAVVELVRSADHFSGVVLVNGHGGNTCSARAAAARCHGEGRRVLVVTCGAAGGDAHAGASETSLLLHLAPEVVRLDRIEAGELRPWSEVRDEVLAGGVAAVSANGVLGDPRDGSAVAGAELFAQICSRVEAEMAAWANG